MKMTETFCDELIAMRNAFFGYDEKTAQLGTNTGLTKDEFKFVMRDDVIDWYKNFRKNFERGYITVPECLRGAMLPSEAVERIEMCIAKMDEWQLHQFRVKIEDPKYMRLLQLADQYKPEIRLKLAKNIDKQMQTGGYETAEQILGAEMGMAALLAMDEAQMARVYERAYDVDTSGQKDMLYEVKRRIEMPSTRGEMTR